MSDNAGNEGTESGQNAGGNKPTTFSQEQVNDLIAADRRKTESKFADYDELKSQAAQLASLTEASKSKEDQMAERIAALETQNAESALAARRLQIAAKHGVKEDDLQFLTGNDDESLTKQAQRLAQLYSDKKKTGNHVPQEGTSPAGAPDDEMREFARSVFGTSD